MKIAMKYLLVASLYGIGGMLLGMVMGAKENFTLTPVHAHLNLLGWIAVMLYGLAYEAYPKMAESKLASIQFYTVNAGVILLIPALALLLLGDKSVLPVLIIGELCNVGALFMFFINLWKNRYS